MVFSHVDVQLVLGRGVSAKGRLCACATSEQCLELLDQLARPDWFDQERLCSILPPVFVGRRVGGENCRRGSIALGAREPQHVQACLFGFHAHVGDNYIVLGGLQLLACLANEAAVATSKPFNSRTAFRVSSTGLSSSTNSTRRIAKSSLVIECELSH